MFEKAVRNKIRFDTPQGRIGVEELWDLPLTSRTEKANLDDIARGLYRQSRSGDDVSFVTAAQKPDEILALKFDIVKHVIAVRLAENEKALKSREAAERKQKLLGLIADKENEAIANLPLDELRKMAEAM